MNDNGYEWPEIEENTFASACYEQNSIAELTSAACDGPDDVDMLIWGITQDEWYASIFMAIREKLRDEEERSGLSC